MRALWCASDRGSGSSAQGPKVNDTTHRTAGQQSASLSYASACVLLSLARTKHRTHCHNAEPRGLYKRNEHTVAMQEEDKGRSINYLPISALHPLPRTTLSNAEVLLLRTIFQRNICRMYQFWQRFFG